MALTRPRDKNLFFCVGKADFVVNTFSAVEQQKQERKKRKDQP